MSDEVLVKVDNVSKKFCRSLKRSLLYGVQDIAWELTGRKYEHKLRKDEFWALKDVSFELKRGECLGLIGHNGAGKSTLLKILNGLIRPDRGIITIHGTLGALIELGAGFNPVLTGRENIYINASILGISKKKIDGIIDEIIDFSNLEKFIDTPVQYYSSGMKVRLGFAVATLVLEPDVLILDEVLAVGDARFRNKCYDRIGKLRNNAAVIFVSHSMEQVAQISDLCMCLGQGEALFLGEVSEGIQHYFKELEQKSNNNDQNVFETCYEPVRSAILKWSKLEIHYGDAVELTVEIEVKENLREGLLRIVFYDLQGIVVTEWNSKRVGKKIDLEQGLNVLKINLGPMYLKNGKYPIGFVLNGFDGIREIYRSYKQYVLKINGICFGSCVYQLPAN